MSTKQIHVVELDYTENQLIKSALYVAQGALAGRPEIAAMAAMSVRALVDEMGEERYNNFVKKMKSHEAAAAEAEGRRVPELADLPPELRAMLDTIGGTD